MSNDGQEVHFDESPSMLRTHPGWFFFWCLLIPVVLGIVALLIWHLLLRNTRLTIEGDRVLYRSGLFSVRESEIRVDDVRNVEITKTFFQRLFGTGELALSTSGQSGMEIVITGLRDPERVRGLINRLRK
jgi:uncharacterized membrane protein YdbT with pleckstrin-like domain